ncbi:MAG: hypothetical protein JWQ38_663 [Flavipsychrobacter sp.]|nr:hypothetical protein [Flavipsychrobacter sp.]
MAVFNRKAKPFVELIYWFIIFFSTFLLFTYHKSHYRDRSGDAIGQRIAMSVFVGVFYALIVWGLNGLFRVISKKLFD